MPINVPNTPRVLRGAERVLGPGWSVIDTTPVQMEQGQTAIATAGQYDTFKYLGHNYLEVPVDQIRLLYPNWCKDGGTILETATNQNELLIRAGLQAYGSSKSDETKPCTKVPFYSREIGYAGNNACLLSDPVDFNLSAAAQFWYRSAVTVGTNGQTYPTTRGPLGSAADYGLDNGEGWGTNVQKSISGTVGVNTTNAGYGPCAVLGRAMDGVGRSSACVVGDSLSAAVASIYWGYGGYLHRALAQNTTKYGMTNVAWGSNRMQYMADAVNGTAGGWHGRLDCMKYFTHWIIALGRNDINAGARTLAQLKADALTVALRGMSTGHHVVLCTILPQCTSTDGWETVANQTQETGAVLTVKNGYNDWLRDTSASGFVAQATAAVSGIPGAGRADYLDPCLYVECNVSGTLTLNGGYMLGAQGSTTVITTVGTYTSPVFIRLTGNSWTWKQWQNYVAFWSGGGAVKSGAVLTNGIPGVDPIDAIQIVTGFSNNVTTGQTIRLYKGLMHDQTHPAQQAHDMIGDGLVSSGRIAQVMAL